MLSDKDIAAIKSPTDRAKVPHRMGNGLFLMAHKTGARYWVLRYRVDGKQKEATVGKPWPQTKAKQAVMEAAVMRKAIQGGSDPLAERRKARIERSRGVVSDFAEAALAWHTFRKQWWKANTAGQVLTYLEQDVIPAFRRRTLDDITTADIADLLDQYDKRGVHDTAVKIRQWLGKVYEFARAKGWTSADPTRDLKALHVHYTTTKRKQPHVSQAEVPELVKAIRTYTGSPIVRKCAELMLWTANRPGVTRTLKWSELDLDAGLWTIQQGREHHKEGHRHITTLPRQALAALRDLHPLTGHLEHVFPGRNDPRSPLSDAAVNAMLKKQGFDGRQTPHGFRHVVSTALNERGHRPDLIERQLAHGDPDRVRSTYNEAMLIPERRTMMQAWADELDQMAAELSTV